MNREARKIRAQETVNIIENGFYTDTEGKDINIKQEITDAIENTKYLKSNELEQLKDTIHTENNYETNFSVTHEDSISAILRLHNEGKKNIMCLNFASAKNPGGGFLNGSLAQEESLAVSSALHKCQMSVFDFYVMHRNMTSCIYTDAMIYSPNVPVFRNVLGDLLSNKVTCNFITSPAVNKGAVKNNEPRLVDTVNEVMDIRIEKMLALCVKEKQETLILGAWGCGVFQNEPKDIAGLFHKHLQGKFKNQFKNVVFAIYAKNEKFINAFNTVFNN